MTTHHRKLNRHQGWNYGADGYYFVTICTDRREHLFDTPQFREIAEIAWQKIPSYKSITTIRIDEWVVMPDHLHGIVIIKNGTDVEGRRPKTTISGTLGAVIGAYKSAVTLRINKVRATPHASVWQRGYYDRIIRNERELDAVRIYIRNNPVRWANRLSDDP